jgi:hypothetical protein
MFVVPFVLLFLAGSAVASPACTAVKLDQYILNNGTLADACQIGNLLFYDFNLTVNTGSGVAANQVTVTPQIASPSDPVMNPGIKFSSMPITVTAGNTMDVTIDYVVATLSGSALIEDYGLSNLTGSANTGWGTVTVSFDNTGQVLLGGVGSFSGTPVSHIDFSPFVNQVHVTTEIHVTKPSDGTGLTSISIVQENFSEKIPEPYASVLIGSGLVLLGLRRIRVKPGA